MDEDPEVNIQELAADELRELLLEAGEELSGDQADELARLVRAAGGLDEAIEALQIFAARKAA